MIAHIFCEILICGHIKVICIYFVKYFLMFVRPVTVGDNRGSISLRFRLLASTYVFKKLNNFCMKLSLCHINISFKVNSFATF